MRTVEILSSAVFLFFIYSCQNSSKNPSVYNPEKITIAGGASIKHAVTDYSIKESLTV